MGAGRLWFGLSDQEAYSRKIFQLRLEGLDVFSYGRMDAVASSTKRELPVSKILEKKYRK